MEPTDVELMLRAQAGDVAAFAELANRYREPLRRFFVALIADHSQADDCVQETFLRVWINRDRYAPTGRVSTYLFQYARHYGLNRRKKLRHEAVVTLADETLIVEAPPASQPEMALLERMREARIRRAVAALPEHYRLVFTLNHFEGLKYAEIACRLEIPVGTVKSRMAEAVRRLRAALSTEEGD